MSHSCRPNCAVASGYQPSGNPLPGTTIATLEKGTPMTADISTRYLGLRLPNPIVVSACPLTGELDVLKKLADFGAAAAVMPSLFEEQVALGVGIAPVGRETKNDPRIVDNVAYYHELKEYNRGPEVYLKYLASAKR